MKLSSLAERFTVMETMMKSTVKTAEIRREDIPKRLADGDPEAPREMIETYYPELYRYARAMMRDRHVAEDIVHDSFVNALEALGKYRQERIRELALRAWLYRIVLNNIRTHARKTSRRAESQMTGEHIPSEETHDPDGVMDVLDALSKLPQKQRVALTLRYMQDLRYAEIAAATGWPENTAKTLVRRGLSKLRETMNPMNPQQSKEER